ncbi:MAG: 3'-5' exonuclease [Candidatus Aenigmarchaeota archaeon]|nr:3'-5' exonuclease [Candidatus Aenigmarchaeota archaeon]
MTCEKSCVVDVECINLEPWLSDSKIICVGSLNCSNGEIKIFYSDNEKEMLEEFFDYFYVNNFNCIIGFNTLFDLRYLLARSLKHQINVNGFFKTKYDDVMLLLNSCGYRYSLNRAGQLSEWSEFLLGNGNGKIKLEEEVSELYKHGKMEEILKYNKQDLVITHALWKRIKEVLG